MKENIEKYADVILNKCLKVKKNEALFVICPMERYDFARIIAKKAYEMGITDVYFHFQDAYIKHEQIKNLDIAVLEKMEWWNGEKYAMYASKNAAFLNLCTEYPGLMDDVDSKKLSHMQKFISNKTKIYHEKTGRNELSWTIAAVPSYNWAKKLFPDEENPVDKLWETILDICCVSNEEYYNEKIHASRLRALKLNNLNIKYFKYTNDLGTNLTVSMPDEYIFHNIEMKLQDGRIILPNIPSEEIYSSVKKEGTNGIVYSSKPLIYNGKTIDEFFLEFVDGKVVNFDAKMGKDSLEELLNLCENSNYLGEIALVEYDSPISNSNILFYTTLYDENASCHFALGQSFADAIKNGENKKKEELEKAGLNQCLIHVDFMIGTRDLKIVAITNDDEEITIFNNGNFVI